MNRWNASISTSAYGRCSAEASKYLGEPNAAEKYELLGGAFALLNPIQWPEPFGLVMIEALACGTPVVATPCGSAPEIIAGDTGFVRSDLSSLAEALNRAQELDRRRCRATAVSCFSTSRMVDDHVALYTRLLEADPEDRGGQVMDDAVAAGATIGRGRVRRQPCCAGPLSPQRASGRRYRQAGECAEVDESSTEYDTGETSSAGSRLPTGVALICSSRSPTPARQQA